MSSVRDWITGLAVIGTILLGPIIAFLDRCRGRSTDQFSEGKGPWSRRLQFTASWLAWLGRGYQLLSYFGASDYSSKDFRGRPMREHGQKGIKYLIYLS